MADNFDNADIAEDPKAGLDNVAKTNVNVEALNLMKNLQSTVLEGKVEVNVDQGQLIASNDIYGQGLKGAEKNLKVVTEPIKDLQIKHGNKGEPVTVKAGDNLWKIAGQELGPGKHSNHEIAQMVQKIAELNHLRHPDMIHAGDKLKMPGDEASKEGGKKDSHEVTVKAGDSLWKIAGHELGPGKHTAQEILQMVNKIAEANNIKNPNLIHPGEKLKIPLKPGVPIESKEKGANSTATKAAATDWDGDDDQV